MWYDNAIMATDKTTAARPVLADRMRSAMRLSKVTDYAISKATGISASTLGRFRKSVGDLTLTQAQAVCDAIGCKIKIERGDK